MIIYFPNQPTISNTNYLLMNVFGVLFRIFFGRNISTLTFAPERWQSGRMRRS